MHASHTHTHTNIYIYLKSMSISFVEPELLDEFTELIFVDGLSFKDPVIEK
jgi:hypothetical protein